MRELLASLLGVPGTILIAAGLGLAGVTVASRLMPGRSTIRWAHLGLGVGLLGCGVALVGFDITLLSPH